MTIENENVQYEQLEENVEEQVEEPVEESLVLLALEEKPVDFSDKVKDKLNEYFTKRMDTIVSETKKTVFKLEKKSA